MASSAASANQAMLPCPAGSTTKAASSGPRGGARIPAHLKQRLGEAMASTGGDARHARGFGVEHGRPEPYAGHGQEDGAQAVSARASIVRPTRVAPIPRGSEYGVGRRSV